LLTIFSRFRKDRRKKALAKGAKGAEETQKKIRRAIEKEVLIPIAKREERKKFRKKKK
jgi:hypothetical protein